MKSKKTFFYKVLSLITTFTFLFSNTHIAQAVDNPSLSDSCGLNIILVLDSSTSMAVSDIDTARSAAITLVNALMPNTPTKMGVIDFNTAVEGTSVPPTTDKVAVLDKIDTYVNHPGGASTNWQAALDEANTMAGAGDLVVMISDGNPNTPAPASVALSDAVASADTVKASGARILAVGINSSGTQGGLSQANLEAISGPQVVNFPGQTITDINQVDVAIGDISELSAALSGLATALCPADISITATTPYDIIVGDTVSFTYTVVVSKGSYKCRLLDNNQVPVNGGVGAGDYRPGNSIDWIPPLIPGTYGYFVQCQTTAGSPVTALSNPITVTVSPVPAADLTASAPPQTTAPFGSAAPFTSVISNIGNAATLELFYNFFQVATGVGGTGTITDLPASSMLRVNPGGVATTNTSYTFSNPGPWSVRACANKTNSSTFGTTLESEYSNNCSAWTDVIVASPPVPVVTITVSPITGIVNNVNPTITWSATNNPTSCTASGDWSGSKAVGGGVQSQGVLTSVRNYTYTLTCTNAGGTSVPQSATVVVNPIPPPATAILSSNPSPAVIVLGQPVLLTWTSTGAVSCTGSGFNTGNAASNGVGVSVIPPALPTTYSITCYNSLGVPSAPSSVTVTATKKKPIYTEP